MTIHSLFPIITLPGLAAAAAGELTPKGDPERVRETRPELGTRPGLAAAGRDIRPGGGPGLAKEGETPNGEPVRVRDTGSGLSAMPGLAVAGMAPNGDPEAKPVSGRMSIWSPNVKRPKAPPGCSGASWN
jgi:hypothetical protein